MSTLTSHPKAHTPPFVFGKDKLDFSFIVLSGPRYLESILGPHICLSVTLSFSLEFVVHLSLIYHGSAFFGGNSSGDVLCVLWLCVYAYTLWRRLVCYPPKAVPSRL